MGIQRLFSQKILEVCRKYDIKGDAFALGNQTTTFSTDWINSIINQSKNGDYSLKDIEDLGSHFCRTEDFFKILGFSSYTDFDYNGKAKIGLDLGKEIPKEFHNKADLLFDGGVIEHIPDIYQALSNIVLMVKNGGIIIHAVPTAIYSESYYSIDPMLLRDFYELNGFETIEIFLFYNQDSFLVKIKTFVFFNSFIRYFTPQFLINYSKKKIEEKHELLNAVPTNFDPISIMKIINNVFDKKVTRRFQSKGLPYGMHVFYIGIKRHDIELSDIKAPTQGNYPNELS